MPMPPSSKLAPLLLLACCCSVSLAKVIYVNQAVTGDVHNGAGWSTAYPTIGETHPSYVLGDEVWVAKGIYIEKVTVARRMALYGGFAGTETARDQRVPATNVTTIDRNGRGPALQDNYGAGQEVVDGFTLRNGKDNVVHLLSSCVLSNNTIIGVPTGNAYGGGISADGQNTVTINNNVIRGCRASAGGGIYIGPEGNATLTGNTVTGNLASEGGGIFIDGTATAAIVGNTITNNSFDAGYSSSGGGIQIQESAMATVSSNTISGNSTNNNGGGILCSGAGAITGNRITGNTCSVTEGAGIDIRGGSVSVEGNVITGNSTGVSGNGGGIAVENGSPMIVGNTVYGNTAGISGGGVDVAGGSVSLRDNTISANSAESGGGIAVRQNGTAVPAAYARTTERFR